MKFSPCGKLLASVGKDQLIRVWALRTEYAKFTDLQSRYATNSATEPVSQHKKQHVSLVGLKPVRS